MMVILQVTVASWIVFSSVNSASLPPSLEPASWCILETNSAATPDLLECSFDNPVKTIQLDYYSHDLPEVAVSCDETCDVSAVLSTMFRVSRVQPRVLTVDILQVSPRNAGRYRCQAMQDATQLAVEGKCSTAVGKGEDEEDSYLYFLPILAIVPIALIIVVIVCKVKSCGFWKSQLRQGREHSTSSQDKAEHPEEESLMSPPDEQTAAANEGRKIERQEATTIGAAADDVITRPKPKVDRQEATTIGAAADDVTTRPKPKELEILQPSEDEQTDRESLDKEKGGHDLPEFAADHPPLSPLEKVQKRLEGEGYSPEVVRKRSLVNEEIKCREAFDK